MTAPGPTPPGPPSLPLVIVRAIKPATYRTIVAVAGASLAVIVLTGAAVRLTEAGLGCENWPACSDDRFVPEWSFHPWIEFGNRLLSGVVALAVAVAALTAYRRVPRRPDLIAWAWGLVAGVAAQIVLGGITVRVDLHPAFVGMHFLLSMVLLWNAIVLWVRASGGPSPTGPSPFAGHGRLLVGLASLVLVTGTLVTGTGPNSGDSRAERLDFDLVGIARVHSLTVWCYLAVLVTLALRLRTASALGDDSPAFGPARVLLAVAVAQGGIGYWQFATGVPPILVAGHIVGAIIVWCLSVLVHLRLFPRAPIDEVGAEHGETELEKELYVAPVFDKMGS